MNSPPKHGLELELFLFSGHLKALSQVHDGMTDIYRPSREKVIARRKKYIQLVPLGGSTPDVRPDMFQKG